MSSEKATSEVRREAAAKAAATKKANKEAELQNAINTAVTEALAKQQAEFEKVLKTAVNSAKEEIVEDLENNQVSINDLREQIDQIPMADRLLDAGVGMSFEDEHAGEKGYIQVISERQFAIDMPQAEMEVIRKRRAARNLPFEPKGLTKMVKPGTKCWIELDLARKLQAARVVSVVI